MNAHVERRLDAPHDAAPNDAQLHSLLREVPLPAGFMRRMREFVEQGIELSE
jgi:hypothetical protein